MGVLDDVDRDSDRAGELAGVEIGFEGDFVPGWDCEFGEAGLALELLQSLRFRHCYGSRRKT